MDNSNYTPTGNSITGLFGFMFAWAFIALNNLLAFSKSVTLDDVQKFFAIVASIVVTAVTILTFLRNQKKKK